MQSARVSPAEAASTALAQALACEAALVANIFRMEIYLEMAAAMRADDADRYVDLLHGIYDERRHYW